MRDELPGGEDERAVGRAHVRGGDAAEEPQAERASDLVRILPVDGDPALRPAVLLGDDHVLGHIHQAAREVAGHRGFEGRVGRALPGAVGRDEVLEHV